MDPRWTEINSYFKMRWVYRSSNGLLIPSHKGIRNRTFGLGHGPLTDSCILVSVGYYWHVWITWSHTSLCLIWHVLLSGIKPWPRSLSELLTKKTKTGTTTQQPSLTCVPNLCPHTPPEARKSSTGQRSGGVYSLLQGATLTLVRTKDI